MKRARATPTSVSFLIQWHPTSVHHRDMSWKTIRLELAPAARFPHGSPHRCYLLYLPLQPTGLIDEEMVRLSPRNATVRRFWPSQPDLRGCVIKMPDGWAFSYEARDDSEAVFLLDTHPMRIGECITLTEPDGERLPYRITNVQSLN